MVIESLDQLETCAEMKIIRLSQFLGIQNDKV
jgi:hypothetical protein